MRFSPMLVSAALALAARNVATAQPFICHLCKDQKFPGKPKGGVVMLHEVVQMAKPIYTCEELYYLGLKGGITDRICLPLVVSMKEHCQCDEFNVGPPDNIWTAKSPTGDVVQWKVPWAHWEMAPPSSSSSITPGTAARPFVTPVSFPTVAITPPPPKLPTTTTSNWAPAPINVWPPKPYYRPVTPTTTTTTTSTSWNTWPWTVATPASWPKPPVVYPQQHPAPPPMRWPGPWTYFTQRADESPVIEPEEARPLSLTPTTELPPMESSVALKPSIAETTPPSLIQPSIYLPPSRPVVVSPPISLPPIGLLPARPFMSPIGLAPAPVLNQPTPSTIATTSASPVVVPASVPPTRATGIGNNNPKMKMNNDKKQMMGIQKRKMDHNRPMMMGNMNNSKNMNDKDTGKGQVLRGHS